MSADFSFSKISVSDPVTMAQTFEDMRDIFDSLATLGAGTITSPRTNHKKWSSNQLQNFNGSTWDNIYPIADWSSLVNKPAFNSGRILYGNGTDPTTNANLTTDGTKIHVGTASSFTGNYLYQLNNTDSALLVRQDGSAAIQTWNALGSDKMTLTAAGDLLVGDSGNIYTKIAALVSSGSPVPTLGVGSGHFAVSNGLYGLAMGTASSGQSWLQAHRFDGTATAYDLLIQPVGGNVGLGTTSPASYLSGTTGLVISTPNAGFALNATATGKTYLAYGASNNLKLYEPSIPADIIDINAGGKVLFGVGGGTALARVDARDTTGGAQFLAGYDISNYMSTTVNGTGVVTCGLVGSNVGASLSFDSTSYKPIGITNVNANAGGAVFKFNTAGSDRGFIGALRHGSAADVLFTGETADALGIRGETAIEFGIGPTGTGRWNSTGLAVGGLFTALGKFDARATSGAQIVASYDASNYVTHTVNSSGQLTIDSTGNRVTIEDVLITSSGIGSGATASIAVSSDTTIQIAGGNVLQGMYHVVANGPSGKHQKITLLVSAHQFDSDPICQVISNHSYYPGLNPHMLTNFRVQKQSGGDGYVYLVCDVGNRGGQTITVYASSQGAYAGTVQMKLTPDTASVVTNVYGINVTREGFLALNVQGTSHAIEVGSTSSNGNGAYCSVTGNWTNGSDRSKKTDIFDLTVGLSEILQLKPCSFRYLNNQELQYGLVAQDVKDVLPALVEGQEPNLALRTHQLIFPIINAIQELAGRITALEQA